MIKTSRLIGLVGFARSGKSTATAALIERHNFIRVRFAQPLKDMLRAIGLSEAQIDGNLKTEPSVLLSGQTPRHAMQTLGTEWGRDCIHQDFWINLWRRQARDILDEGGSVVIDDCRFENEAKAIIEFGGEVWRIIRPGLKIDATHSSESEQTKIDTKVILHNDGSIEDLAKAISSELLRSH